MQQEKLVKDRLVPLVVTCSATFGLFLNWLCECFGALRDCGITGLKNVLLRRTSIEKWCYVVGATYRKFSAAMMPFPA